MNKTGASSFQTVIHYTDFNKTKESKATGLKEKNDKSTDKIGEGKEETGQEIVFPIYVKLILESSEGYYFRTYQEKTILISRDKVVHIIFQEPPPTFFEPVK